MKIETQDYEWECGDGCCFSCGTYLFLDGVKQYREFGNTCDALTYVLRTLGHEVEEIYPEDDE